MLTPAKIPPETEAELLDRADRLAGRMLKEVAASMEWEVPPNQQRHKGWVGQLIETWLGAAAGNRPVPDFEVLGIELKTIPVDSNGKPFESTYVSTMELSDVDDVDWETSSVSAKLKRVLWVPVQGDKDIPLGDRMIGRAVLWSPSDREESALKKDWNSHMRAARDGFAHNIRGSDGDFLQVRPKAADSTKQTWGVDEFGGAILTKPRGFYLRALFTEYVLRTQLAAARDTLNSIPDGNSNSEAQSED